MSNWYEGVEKDIQEKCKHKWALVAQQMKCDYCGKVYEVR